MNRPLLFAVGAITLAACNPAPLKNGTLIEGTSKVNTETRSYKLKEGGGPEERTGNKGVGDNCTEAGNATGRTVVTADLNLAHSLEVVGESHTDQPLDPEEGREGRTAVSVIAEKIVARGSMVTEADAYDAGPEGEDVFSIDETPDVALTSSRYFGLAGDEYLVELSPLDLWTPVSFAEAGAGGDPDRMDLVLLTKRKPKNGDVWTSIDGKTLYRYLGNEKLNAGGNEFNADKVGVYIVAESDPEVASMIDDCLSTGPFQDVTNPGVEEDNIVSSAVLLDAGCDGEFMHQQVGTEWWGDDILLKAESTTWDVTVDAFGYEWYVQDGDTCARNTGPVAPEDTGSNLFVQYTVTRTIMTYQVDSIGEAAEGGN
ncbi:MAG: hypothetical protein ACI8PZ_005516 [Myxococcota bacterium]|jgi:hypothetical protein